MSNYSEKLRREKREELALRMQLVRKEELAVRVETSFSQAEEVELGILKKIIDTAKSVVFDENKHPRGKDGQFAKSSGSSSNKEVDSLNKQIDAISAEQKKAVAGLDAQLAKEKDEMRRLYADNDPKNADKNFYALTKLGTSKVQEQRDKKYNEFEKKKSPLIKKRDNLVTRLNSESEAKKTADKAKATPKPIASGQRKPSML